MYTDLGPVKQGSLLLNNSIPSLSFVAIMMPTYHEFLAILIISS
jgi:hypothetical protein